MISAKKKPALRGLGVNTSSALACVIALGIQLGACSSSTGATGNNAAAGNGAAPNGATGGDGMAGDGSVLLPSSSGGGATPSAGASSVTAGVGGAAAAGIAGASSGLGGTGSGAGGTGSAGEGASPAGAAGVGGTSATDPNQRHLLLRDEAQSMVSYVALSNPASDWHVATGSGRDMQLVGSGHFMIGTNNGYEERLISTGALVSQRNNFPGTLTAHRLRNGNTLLAGVNWQGGTGIVLVEVDGAGMVAHTLSFPAFSYVRLIRQTPTGTFLVTAENVVFESDATGKIVWQANIVNPPAGGAHAWQALRIPSGETVVTAGYAANMQIFGADGTLHKTITGPANVIPYQFVGFQILPTGNFVVANWQGHSGEKMGTQLLEYNPNGDLVWSYRPNLKTESLSLHHVIVLDGLDLSKLYVDDTTGVLVPVP